jgi:hypothetical protein
MAEQLLTGQPLSPPPVHGQDHEPEGRSDCRPDRWLRNHPHENNHLDCRGIIGVMARVK